MHIDHLLYEIWSDKLPSVTILVYLYIIFCVRAGKEKLKGVLPGPGQQIEVPPGYEQYYAVVVVLYVAAVVLVLAVVFFVAFVAAFLAAALAVVVATVAQLK